MKGGLWWGKMNADDTAQLALRDISRRAMHAPVVFDAIVEGIRASRDVACHDLVSLRNTRSTKRVGDLFERLAVHVLRHHCGRGGSPTFSRVELLENVSAEELQRLRLRRADRGHRRARLVCRGRRRRGRAVQVQKQGGNSMGHAVHLLRAVRSLRPVSEAHRRHERPVRAS